MATHRPLLSLALAVALLLGQWLAAGHDRQHGLQPGAADACAVCVYSHAAAGGSMLSLPPLPVFTNDGLAESFAADRLSVAPLRQPPIRGPPTRRA